MTSSNEAIPVVVCSVVGRHLGRSYSHRRLDALFSEAGAPDGPPQGNCEVKCATWLKRCSRDPNVDALAVLGEVLAEFMDAWPEADHPEHLGGKAEVEQTLAEYGLRYHGGRVVRTSSSPSTKDLQSIIRSIDSASLRAEFDRSLDTVESDPDVAITSACALFETFCNVYIEDEGLDRPARAGAQALWKVVRSHANLSPDADMDKNLKQILSGLASVVDGMSSLRNRSGSAHGRGRRKSRVRPRHARLAVNAAHALVTFLYEVWRHRQASGSTLSPTKPSEGHVGVR